MRPQPAAGMSATFVKGLCGATCAACLLWAWPVTAETVCGEPLGLLTPHPNMATTHAGRWHRVRKESPPSAQAPRRPLQTLSEVDLDGQTSSLPWRCTGLQVVRTPWGRAASRGQGPSLNGQNKKYKWAATAGRAEYLTWFPCLRRRIAHSGWKVRGVGCGCTAPPGL